MSRFRKGAIAAGFSAVALLAVVAAPALAGKLGLGREAKPEEVTAWNIDVRPDGQGLPVGKGSVAQGETLFQERCASCHGEFGEGKGRWPVLAGGAGSLKADRPEKTVGSFWSESTTLFDYIRRAMPYGNAQSLEPDEVYALTAYILQLNDVIKDDVELNERNLAGVRMPNAGAFRDDDRESAERAFWGHEPCMKDCKGEARILNRAQIIDVTPGNKSAPRVE